MPASEISDDDTIDVIADDATPTTRRGRKAAGDDLVTTSLTLSTRVIEHFKASGEDWQSRLNEALNIIVNRTHAREAKKRARLRARSAVRRRLPPSGG
ncbi:BrnA antitoxin family protein [Kaistia adipata]|uniref:BrnA antitoxin family protein n=1 Tax=Kaistia adipata TaxID=166954 RepID=UPI0004073C0E|nr:BrnA antitoxin family protein [Kaistia adipata]